MTPGHRFRVRTPPFWIAALVVASVVAPAPAEALSTSSGSSDLSSRLAELATPALRTAPEAEQAAALSVAAEGPGSLLRDGRRVLVDVRFGRAAADAADALRMAGGSVVSVNPLHETVTITARPADLRAIAAVPRVESVTEILAPVVSATCSGLVTSEGDAQLGAFSARSTFGVDGSGVEVGILSDSFDDDVTAPTSATQDVASGDLPGPGNPCGRSTPVGVFQDLGDPGEATDEGRAMAQIVHDLAPGASISFATAFNGMFGFAQNIRALQLLGADVIADDVFYLEEPFFQDGPVAVAVNEVTAAGAAYFSAVGNNNLIDEEGRDIASWEAPEFRDSESCPAPLEAIAELKAEQCMDFDPDEGETDDTFGITVEAGETLLVDLQWAEPWLGVKTDLDAFLLDSNGDPLEVEVGEGEFDLVAAGDDNLNTQRPLEVLQWENDTGSDQEVQLVLNRFAGEEDPRLKFALIENGGGVSSTEYPESAGGDLVGPTIFGHGGAAAAVGVGAVRFNDSSKPEAFSSRGPLTHYFGPVGGKLPAAELSPAEEISKPDLVATDGAANTFFGSFQAGLWRFFGTSAAAPHAAAVAALMRQANPSLSFSQMRTALAATATPVGAFGPNAVGAGMVNAYGAVSSVALPPTISITERPEALSNNTRPSIGFTANRPVSFSCSIDGGGPQPCSSPFVPAVPLAEGVHGIAVSGVDAAGRAGTSETVSFEIDARPPRTFFRKHPPKTIRTRHRRARAAFRFGSNESGVTFICKVDSGFLRFCGKQFARRFSLGKHVVRVKARDAAGNVDRSPAVFRFQVKRIG